jgi:hypothetical protein
MGNTANNNWPYPESTDLVKDGATAIENLADAIDTTLGVFTPSTPGLSLISTTSFSGVSSQSFNDVFSATYVAYKIIFNFTTSTATTNMRTRLRVGGSDESGANAYRTQYIFGNNTSTGGSRDLSTSWFHQYIFNSRPQATYLDVFNPFASVTTTAENKQIENADGNIALFTSVYGINNTTSYTGFTTFVDAGTMTGSIAVLGYSS